MIKQKVFTIFTLTLFLTSVYAQNPVNQFDKDGLRHGIWTKNYHNTDQKRYEGVFKHGKEIDSKTIITQIKNVMKGYLSMVKKLTHLNTIRYLQEKVF